MDSQPSVLPTLSDQPSVDSAQRSAESGTRSGDQDAARSQARGNRWSLWLSAALLSIVLAVIVLLFYWAGASVSGVELDATTWQTRRFEFLRDPFTDTQLTNVRHTQSGQFTLDPAIAVHIGGGPIRPRQPRWDLVSIHRGARSGQGDARVLLRYLRATDSSNDLYWVKWTSDHPQAAAILWRAVRDVVHLERYDHLPEIFDAARVDDQAGKLRARLQQIMLAAAGDEAQKRIAAGDRASALRAATLGVTYGQSPELQAVIDDAR